MTKGSGISITPIPLYPIMKSTKTRMGKTLKKPLATLVLQAIGSD